MLYRKMPKTGDDISILGFGCMRLPGKRMGVDEERAIKQIQSAIDSGVNYLDTAWPYHNGQSEVILGKALSNGYRAKVKIADKLPQWLCKKPEHLDYYLDAQLERLGVDVIDYYLVHALNETSWNKIKSLGVIEFLVRAKQSGKIINTGFSFHGPRDDFKIILDDHDWDFCQIQYNILDEHDQAGIEGLEYAASKNVGVVVMEPLRGGSLAGKLPPSVQKVYDEAPVKRTNVEWALRWIWDHPGVVTILSGMNEEAHIEENLRIASEAKEKSLTTEEREVIKKAAEVFRAQMKVPCTGCQYCVPCPQSVNIPQSFSFYNEKYLFKKGLMSRIMYLAQLSDLQSDQGHLAGQCIECGKCIKHCPQYIDIPGELKKVKKEFEGPLTKPLLFLIGKMFNRGAKKD